MIQRIQSVYLFLAILSSAVLFSGLEIFSFQDYESTFSLNLYGINISNDKGISNSSIILNKIFLVFNMIFIAIMFITLFSYKKIKKQLALAKYLLYLSVLLILMLIYTYFQAESFLNSQIETTSLGTGFFFWFLTFPLIFLAFNGVKKDKRLLDSLNRLR